jgi:deoxyribonuclease-1
MIKKFISFALTLHLAIFSSTLIAEHPKNFQEAKKQARIIWSSHPETIYCGCKYDKQLNIDHKSCGYEPEERKRANKVEWEHLVPASWFGKQKECWREPICEKKNGKKYKGRKCCEKIDGEFRKMHSDLHNLVPAIGEVNQARSDYRFGEIYPESREQI